MYDARSEVSSSLPPPEDFASKMISDFDSVCHLLDHIHDVSTRLIRLHDHLQGPLELLNEDPAAV